VKIIYFINVLTHYLNLIGLGYSAAAGGISPKMEKNPEMKGRI